MYKRILVRPHKSFFLLGPRGTGKSTFLRTQTFALKLDLLSSKTRLELERNPSHLTDLCRVLQKNAWVLIDEVQKIPELLDEVHFLIEEHGLNFALSGSSARKLKRADANLLAGRALNCKMFSLVYPEYGEAIPLADRLEWGTLPLVVDQKDLRADTLETYVDNYLRQELVEEGIVRSLAPFSRFLQIAATMNGQILNVENIARESKVGRTTVDSYFCISRYFNWI
jgi:predicted AAA+ superfamily ATPase